MPPLVPVSVDLKCRIVLEEGAPDAGTGVPKAQIELTNRSPHVVEIECPSHPLEHLNLIVTDSAGAIVSRGKYGNLLVRPRREVVPPQRLQPGESLSWPVSLLATVPVEKQKQGAMTVRAVYEYGSVKTESEPVQVSCPGS